MSTRIESGGTRYLDLSDSFYLGGIETEKRQRAFSKGIKAADSSIMVSLIQKKKKIKVGHSWKHLNLTGDQNKIYMYTSFCA